MDGYNRRSMIKGAVCSIATLSMGSIDSGATLLAANCDESPKPSMSPIPKKKYPLDPHTPVFQEMSVQEIKDYSDAHRRAYKQIVAALENLSKQGPDGSYHKWFDSSHYIVVEGGKGGTQKIIYINDENEKRKL